MISHLVPILAVVLAGAIAAGVAITYAARAFAESEQPLAVLMIAASIALGVWAVLVMPTFPLLAISCALGWVLLLLATVDALAFRLPDILTLPLLAAGLAVSWWLPNGDLLGHSIAATLGAAIFYVIAVAYRRARGQEGLGLGDVKLAGVAGAWLGWQDLPFVVLLACAVGLVWVGVATIRRGNAALGERIPFGVALCLAIWIVWLYGPPEMFGPY
jgi:leader peptidase (prepilin peptidase)/N-methyltransferase